MIALILCGLLGISLIYLSLKGYSSQAVGTSIVGGLFIIVGVVAFIVSEDIVVGPFAVTICLFVFSYALAGIVLFGIIINLSKVFAVDTKIMGTFVGKNSKRGGLFPIYTFTFEYTYNGTRYRETTSDTFGLLAALRYKESEEYPIWVAEKKPSVMAARRRPGAGTVCMICMFIACILLPIAYLFR